jgi:L-asparagine transporter-like permease
MAKKLKKVHNSPIRLFVELLTPWVVMAIVAFALRSIGISIETSIIVALTVAIVTTFAIGSYEKKRRTRKHE